MKPFNLVSETLQLGKWNHSVWKVKPFILWNQWKQKVHIIWYSETCNERPPLGTMKSGLMLSYMITVVSRHRFYCIYLLVIIKYTSMTGGLSWSLYASRSPPGLLHVLVRWCARRLLLSSMVTIMGSMMESAVSSSAAREHENTSRLCRLQDNGRSVDDGRILNTAVLCKYIHRISCSPSNSTWIIETMQIVNCWDY